MPWDDAKALELIALEDEQQRWEAANKLKLYVPYPKQREFHAAGATVRQRLLMAGNQCLTPQSVLQTDRGERRIGEMIGAGGFGVRSWADGERQSAQASPVFLKGIEPAFRVHLGNGEAFECSRKHRVLTRAGWVSLGRLMSRAGALHSSRRPSDSTASYGADDRRHDRQPHWAEDSGPAPPPSPAGAREHRRSGPPADVAAQRPSRIHACRETGRLAISDDEHQRLWDLCGRFEGLCGEGSGQHTRSTRRSGRPSPAASGLRRSSAEDRQHAAAPGARCAPYRGSSGAEAKPGRRGEADLGAQRSACDRPLPRSSLESLRHDLRRQNGEASGSSLVGRQQIVAIEAIGYRPILDIHVYGSNAYEASGVIHHNCGKTVSAGAETAMHLTGLYPDWWAGKRWNRPNRGWAASKTSEVTRDTVQRVLLGEPKDRGAMGTGFIPKESIMGFKSRQGVPDALDHALVKHVSGGYSTVGFKSYDQGREKWQGETLDWIWNDEEPPIDVYMEGLTRTNATDGLVWITATPLLGMTEVISMFMKDGL